jgi:hypothetical protein
MKNIKFSNIIKAPDKKRKLSRSFIQSNPATQTQSKKIFIGKTVQGLNRPFFVTRIGSFFSYQRIGEKNWIFFFFWLFLDVWEGREFLL